MYQKQYNNCFSRQAFTNFKICLLSQTLYLQSRLISVSFFFCRFVDIESAIQELPRSTETSEPEEMKTTYG